MEVSEELRCITPVWSTVTTCLFAYVVACVSLFSFYYSNKMLKWVNQGAAFGSPTEYLFAFLVPQCLGRSGLDDYLLWIKVTESSLLQYVEEI